jgi:hypothetical protein
MQPPQFYTYSNFKSKLHPCSCDLSAAAGTAARPAGVGEIHFRRPRRVERLKRNLLYNLD